jgi:hypothetical protein
MTDLKKKKPVLDSDGAEVTAGCVIVFSYGIPPVGVYAQVIERGGKLIALTPGHNPAESTIAQVRKCSDFHVATDEYSIERAKSEAADNRKKRPHD